MRVAIIGGGTIARLFIEQARAGALDGVSIVAIGGRSAVSRAKSLADAAGIALVTSVQAMLTEEPDVVLEAASHEAVRDYGEQVLRAGKTFIVLSAGALADDALRLRLEQAARTPGAMLYVPSGGIGGLDALRTACLAGVDSATISVTKPPKAWRGIVYVDALGIDLDRLTSAYILFEGSAREGVPHFPANVNIAAILSLAGIGLDRTRLKVVADPNVRHNTHHIEVRGASGAIHVQMQNVPSPDNPKTALLACYSALAAVRALKAPVRYGT